MFYAFSTKSYEYMLKDLTEGEKSGQPRIYEILAGSLTRKNFPDGESYHRFDDLSQITGQDVLIIGGTVDDAETMELYDMAVSIVKNGVRSLQIIVPYFGYSTMERAVKLGEVVKAKTRATLLSSIPSGSYPNKIIFVDIHSEGIPHYLEGSTQGVHCYAKPIIIDACHEKFGKDFVLGSTDAGRAKWVESLANDMGVDCAIIIKRRISGSETKVSGINADVTGKVVVIYDDMIRTGGSLVGAAEAYLNAGASEVHAIATHGVLPEDSLQKIQSKGVIKSITVTDTHPRAVFLKGMPSTSGYLDVRSILRAILPATRNGR